MKHVIVAGAGIVGVSTAIWLQREGYEVTLVDREGPAAGTSHGNAGVLASGAMIPVTMPGLLPKVPKMLLDPMQPLYLKFGYLPKLLPFLRQYLSYCTMDDVRSYAADMATLIGDSVEQHRHLAAGTGAEKFIQDNDFCFGYETKAAFDADAHWWQIRKDNGFVVDVETAEEFAAHDPLYHGQFEMIARCKNHGQITDPGEYVKTLAQHFTNNGGHIQLATITGISVDKGKIHALESDQGPIRGDEFVLTTGVWTKALMESLGLAAPVESERGYHVEFLNPSAMPKSPMMVTTGKFVITPMQGRIRCAGVVEFGGTKAGPSAAPIKLLRRRFAELFPDITYDNTVEWLGHRPAPTDSRPLIGALQGMENAYTGFGHQHVGLTGGAKTGRLIAGMITGFQPNIDLKPFSPNRFMS